MYFIPGHHRDHSLFRGKHWEVWLLSEKLCCGASSHTQEKKVNFTKTISLSKPWVISVTKSVLQINWNINLPAEHYSGNSLHCLCNHPDPENTWFLMKLKWEEVKSSRICWWIATEGTEGWNSPRHLPVPTIQPLFCLLFVLLVYLIPFPFKILPFLLIFLILSELSKLS